MPGDPLRLRVRVAEGLERAAEALHRTQPVSLHELSVRIATGRIFAHMAHLTSLSHERTGELSILVPSSEDVLAWYDILVGEIHARHGPHGVTEGRLSPDSVDTVLHNAAEWSIRGIRSVAHRRRRACAKALVGLLESHPFLAGSKRLAHIVFEHMCHLNGISIGAQPTTLIRLVVDVTRSMRPANQKVGVAQRWLQAHAVPIHFELGTDHDGLLLLKISMRPANQKVGVVQRWLQAHAVPIHFELGTDHDGLLLLEISEEE